MFKNYRSNRCYIIAEIGGNFTTLEQAIRLIDLAAECGVDAVKLQTYRADTVASRKAMFDMENTGVTSQYDLFKKYEIAEGLHREVFQYAEKRDMDWFSTPAHEADVDLLEKLNVGAHKIGSDDAVNLPFINYVAKTGKPIILSTGMCTMEEVRETVHAILETGNDKLILLHAITSYPTHPENVNLGAMQAMKHEFPNLDIGYSDHTIGTTACVCAAAMGARVIEKHFTWDKKADGPDHMLSADPSEMREIVRQVREFEVMRGNNIKRPADSEKTTRVNNRKSLVLTRPIAKGERLGRDNVGIKRPGYGIQPKYYAQVLGRQVSRDIDHDEILKWEDLQ